MSLMQSTQAVKGTGLVRYWDPITQSRSVGCSRNAHDMSMLPTPYSCLSCFAAGMCSTLRARTLKTLDGAGLRATSTATTTTTEEGAATTVGMLGSAANRLMRVRSKARSIAVLVPRHQTLTHDEVHYHDKAFNLGRSLRRRTSRRDRNVQYLSCTCPPPPARSTQWSSHWCARVACMPIRQDSARAMTPYQVAAACPLLGRALAVSIAFGHASCQNHGVQGPL